LAEVEARDLSRVRELAVVEARLNYQYPTHTWKELQATRLHQYLSTVRYFTREGLRLWLYRELFLERPGRRETSFIRKVLDLVLGELCFKRYIRERDGFFEVILAPSREECLRILRMQVFDRYT
jgi:hypothetical protein